MPGMHETVYPRFKSSISEKELNDIYTPTQEEINFSYKVSRGDNAKLCFLIMLKSFQRLGYFIALTNIPQAIIQHISNVTNIVASTEVIGNYNKSGTRLRHVQVIREYLNIKPLLPWAADCQSEQQFVGCGFLDKNGTGILQIACKRRIRTWTQRVRQIAGWHRGLVGISCGWCIGSNWK